MTQAFPFRGRPRSHTLDFYSFCTGQNTVRQPHLTTGELGNAVLCLGRHMSRYQFSHSEKERMGSKGGGQFIVSATICTWSVVWKMVYSNRNVQPLELCC